MVVNSMLIIFWIDNSADYLRKLRNTGSSASFRTNVAHAEFSYVNGGSYYRSWRR